MDSRLTLLGSPERQLPAAFNSARRTDYPLWSDEGRNSIMAIAKSRLESIHQHLDAHRVSLLRSPPYTGKTTFIQALQEHCLDLNHQAIYISLAGIQHSEARYDPQLFQDYWRKMVGHTWDEITTCTKRTYVFIDEAHIIYNNCVPFFWGFLKVYMSNPKMNDNLRVLLVASYDPTLNFLLTPIQFTNALGLDTLRLTFAEFQDLTAKYVTQRQGLGSTSFTIAALVQKAIFSFTGGHPGLCRYTVGKIWEKFWKGGSTVSQPGSDAEMIEYLVSSKFRLKLQSTRAFNWMETWNPTVQESRFIRNALLACDSASVCRLSLSSYKVAKAFLKSGLIIEINDELQFTAPIMRISLALKLNEGEFQSSELWAENFEEFMLRAIERMKPSVLKMSLGRGTDNLLERTWQFEWYRAAMTTTPTGAVVSPDVGSVFGSPGYIDFYVDTKHCWGIELLREGQGAQKHADRFTKGGIYEKIPRKEYVLLDFRKSANIGELQHHFWYAIYTDDYRQITVRRLGHVDQVIILRGDEVEQGVGSRAMEEALGKLN